MINQWSDVVWICVGFLFGFIVAINRKQSKESKTLEQLDQALKDELTLNKNLVASLKDDLAYAKKKLQALKDSK